MAQTKPCGGIEALPIHGPKCVAATCDADCKKKHGTSAIGDCFFFKTPDDTCKCQWHSC